MPKVMLSNKAAKSFVGLRMSADEVEFHKAMANRAGKSLSAHLKELIVEGGVSMKLAEIEDRIGALVNRIPGAGVRPSSPGLSDDALFALYSIFETIRNTVTERDPKEWETASKSARAKVDQELSRVRKS